MYEDDEGSQVPLVWGPEVLIYEDAPLPDTGPNEILISVYAAGVNPVDWKIRKRFGREWFGLKLPSTLGCDVAGVVELTGAQVKRFRQGDAVYGYINLRRCGAYAEFAIATEEEVIAKPAVLDFVQAAAVPIGALTAWQGLFGLAHLNAGQKLLIHGAAGGVGSMAVQLAKAKGANVAGTASARNRQFLRELGVDQIIDYQATHFEDAVHGMHVVFDTSGNDTQARSFKALKQRGTIVSTVSEPSEAAAKANGFTGFMIMVQPSAAQLDEIGIFIKSGKVSLALGWYFRFVMCEKRMN